MQKALFKEYKYCVHGKISAGLPTPHKLKQPGVAKAS